ncbi:hypothetical protein ACE6H2_020939 [Prunus campanulata]
MQALAPQAQAAAPQAQAQHQLVAATRGGTSRGRMRGLGRSLSQPQPHALPPNIQGSAPIGPNQMVQLVAATRGGRGRGRMRGLGRSSSQTVSKGRVTGTTNGASSSHPPNKLPMRRRCTTR